jgi:hypothetical protein
MVCGGQSNTEIQKNRPCVIASISESMRTDLTAASPFFRRPVIRIATPEKPQVAYLPYLSIAVIVTNLGENV